MIKKRIKIRVAKILMWMLSILEEAYEESDKTPEDKKDLKEILKYKSKLQKIIKKLEA